MTEHGPGLLGAVGQRGAAYRLLGDRAWRDAMVEVEAALADACTGAGLIPAGVGEAIRAIDLGAADLDIDRLGTDAADAGNPIPPLVRAIEAAVGGPLGSHVHFGATSQDILDTALVLVLKRAGSALLDDLRGAADAAARLAVAHRDTPMVSRTLGQQGLPTTFGLVAAGWLTGLDEAGNRLTRALDSLPVQLGGAAGTLAAFTPHEADVVRDLAGRLGLIAPTLPWHTRRMPVADIAAAMGTTAGFAAKVALDVVVLAATETAEVSEGGDSRGGSSSMPHKHNPVAAISARAGAMRTPGLVATLLAVMPQENERAAGGWHAEWQTLRDLVSCTADSVAWLRDCLTTLRVDTEQMAANLAHSDDARLAEAVATAATPALGRATAHDLVRRLVARHETGLATALRADPDLGPAIAGIDLDALRDSSRRSDSAGRLVDRALAAREATAVEGVS